MVGWLRTGGEHGGGLNQPGEAEVLEVGPYAQVHCEQIVRTPREARDTEAAGVHRCSMSRQCRARFGV